MAADVINWDNIPKPPEDRRAEHITGTALPPVCLTSTDGVEINLADLRGTSVIYAYPLMSRPDVAPPEGWENIPGAKGCTPQSCAYRDHYQDLKTAGADNIFGLSVQDTDYQREAVARLHLPFPLLSDSDYMLTRVISLPTTQVEGRYLLNRLTMLLEDNEIVKIHYPVYPPDQDAENVLNWLQNKKDTPC
ncbi:MAG TPA: peroxiredoxin [Rhodobacteraceae bacterium]|jgi:peroxiredoxin|nr:peroxiredoxin [Paracoccaceae bacterium]